MRALSIALLIAAVAAASDAQAGHRHCNHCGCQQHCRKVCRLICGTKKEVKVEYSCECEDFCVPGPSRKCGVKCECNRLGIKCCHAVYKPVCAQVRTKRVLVKKEVEKEVPDYKWVVEEVCCGCGQQIDGTQQPTASPKAAMAQFGPELEIEQPLSDDSSDIRQVSLEQALPVSDEAEEQAAMISDDGVQAETDMDEKDAIAAPSSVARHGGLLQRLFGR